MSKKEPLYASSLNAMVELIRKMTPKILRIHLIDKKLDEVATDTTRILQNTNRSRGIDLNYFKRVRELELRNNNLVDQLLELQSDNAKLLSDNKRLVAQNFLYWHELKTYVPEHDWFTQGFDDKEEFPDPPEPESEEPAETKKSVKETLADELEDLQKTNKHKKH